MALLDSGADTCTIPVSVAKILELKSTSSETVKGIGGDIKAENSRMILSIEGPHEKHSVSVHVKILNDENIPILLGRKDFFENFNITFKERDKRIILKKVG
jgi:hypothetical protein